MMTTSDTDPALKALNIEVRYIVIVVLYLTYGHISNQAVYAQWSLGARTAVVSKCTTSFEPSHLCHGRRGYRF